MRGGFDQRKLLRVIDSEEAEVHVGNDVRRRWRFRRCIDTPVAAAKHKRRDHGEKKKTDSQTSIFHEDCLSATTSNRHLWKVRRAHQHAWLWREIHAVTRSR